MAGVTSSKPIILTRLSGPKQLTPMLVLAQGVLKTVLEPNR